VKTTLMPLNWAMLLSMCSVPSKGVMQKLNLKVTLSTSAV